MDKITIAIPTYDRDDYLRQAIASILSETEIDLEVLVVDTASPVNVKEIVDSFNDPRLKYFYHPENLGMIGAANKCLELCQTELLMVFPDDDRLIKGGLKKLYAKIVNNTSVAAAIGSVLAINEAGQVTEKIAVSEVDQLLDGATFYKQYLTGKIKVQPAAVLLRKTALDRAGHYDELVHYCPDMDLWLRIALQGKIALVAEEVGEYRIHGGTATAKFRRNAEIGRSYRDLLKKHYKLAKSAGIFEESELEETFRVASSQHAGSCIAIGLDCFKNGHEDVARQYFSLAYEMTPRLLDKVYVTLLSVSTFAGQPSYSLLQKLKRIGRS